MRLRTSERISFEQNEVIEFAPGVRTHPARLDTILRRPSQLCGVRACAVVPRPLTVGLAGVAQNPLTSILGSLGQALYGSGSGRVPFQPAFWRGGTPQPSNTITTRRGSLVRWKGKGAGQKRTFYVERLKRKDQAPSSKECGECRE